MDSIFVDTNSVGNRDCVTFFGQADKFKKLSELAQIYVPTIVIEEIKNQKIIKLRSDFDKFRSNHFRHYYECDVDNIGTYLEDKVKELYDSSKNEFDYIELDVEPHLGHLTLLKDLAVANQAPFEKESDKGFKDAYIFLIISQYKEKNPSDNIFFISNDGRLTEALKAIGITILSTPEKYLDYTKQYFASPYFIQSLNQFINESELKEDLYEEYTKGTLSKFIEDEVPNINLDERHIKEIDLNEDNDWIIRLEYKDIPFQVLIDFATKEIIEGEII